MIMPVPAASPVPLVELIVVWMSTTAGVTDFAIALTELEEARGAADPLVVGATVFGAVPDALDEAGFELTATPTLAPTTPATNTAANTAARVFFFDHPLGVTASSVRGKAAHWPPAW
jgi:hypothetical protein